MPPTQADVIEERSIQDNVTVESKNDQEILSSNQLYPSVFSRNEG